MFAVVPSAYTRFGTMSVMRQFVHGAGSVVRTLCSCPGVAALLPAGIVNGPYSARLRSPGLLGMSPRGSLYDEIEVTELACAGAVIAAIAHRQTVAIASPIDLIVPSPPSGRSESSPNRHKRDAMARNRCRSGNEQALHCKRRV